MKSIEQTVAQTQNFMLGQFILSMLLNLVLSGTLSQLWNIFNTLQLLTSLPLFQVNTPANVVAIHATFDKLSHFQVVDKKLLYSWMLEPLFGPASESDAGEDVSNIEAYYRGTTLAMNILIAGIGGLLFALIILLVVRVRRAVLAKPWPITKNLLLAAERKLILNSILRLFLESYFGTAISILYAISFATSVCERISSWFLLLLFIAGPITAHCVLLKKQASLPKEAIKQRIGSLYQNVDTYSRRALGFTLFFCTRRLVFAAVIALLAHIVVLQVFVAEVSVLAMLYFYCRVRPMKDTANNLVQMCNEGAVLLCLLALFVFTDLVPDPAERYSLAYYFLYFIAANVALNLLVLGFTIFVKIRQVFMRRHAAKMRKAAEARARNAQPKAVINLAMIPESPNEPDSIDATPSKSKKRKRKRRITVSEQEPPQAQKTARPVPNTRRSLLDDPSVQKILHSVDNQAQESPSIQQEQEAPASDANPPKKDDSFFRQIQQIEIQEDVKDIEAEPVANIRIRIDKDNNNDGN